MAIPHWAQQPDAAPALPSNKDVALQLAAMGMLVFPCKPDKTPRDGLLWQQQASCDAAAVERMFSDPSFLPAIPASLNGLLVIDCDVHAGNGTAEWEALCSANSIDLAQAVIVETASGGRHYYFRTADEYSQAKLTANIDVRSVGYVVAAGSSLPDGRSYRLIAGDGMPVPALPAALAALLQAKRPDALPAAPGALLGTATERDRDYFLKPFTAEREKLRALPQGRNEALMRIAKFAGNYVHYGFDRLEIEAALYADSVANGYVAAHGSAAAWTTIRHNITDGMTRPSPMPSAQSGTAEDRAAVRAQLDAAKPSQFGIQRKIALQSFAGIEEQPITWLWDGYLPSGKLTLLAGAGGTGKSTIAFSFAAIITTGGAWPDGTRCKQPGNVVIWSSEDDPADTIKPRLMAMQADTARCYNIAPHIDDQGNRLPFDPARDMDKLREQIAQLAGGVSLFVIDPIVSAVSGDMHKANDVRRSLQAVVDFAAEQNCAVLGITHFAKGTAGRNSAERVIGSQAFSAFARMVLVAAKEEDSERRVFTRAKSNNPVDNGGFSYTVQMVQGKAQNGKQLETTRILWGEALEGSSRAILADVEGEEKAEDGSAMSKAKQFLLQQLRNGSLPSKELLEHGREALNISDKTLKRAKEQLGITASKDGFNGGWRWELPYNLKAMQALTAHDSDGPLPWTN